MMAKNSQDGISRTDQRAWCHFPIEKRFHTHYPDLNMELTSSAAMVTVWLVTITGRMFAFT